MRMHALLLGVCLLSARPGSRAQELEVFIRGDVDGSGTVDEADARLLAEWLWRDGPPPVCMDAGDANDDGVVSEEDAVRILRFARDGRPPLPPPFPDPGPDPTRDGIGCGTYDPPAEIAPMVPDVILAAFGGEGEPGEGDVEVPVMLRGPVPVGGLTVAVRWDPAQLRLREIRRTGETIPPVRDAEVFESKILSGRGEASFSAFFALAGDAVLPPQEDFVCVGKLVFEIPPSAEPLGFLPVEIEARVGDVPRFTGLATSAGPVIPRRVGCSIAVRAPGRREIRQSVRVPILGLPEDPLAQVEVLARFDPETGAGRLAFAAGGARGKIGEFPYCFLGAHLMAMILRGLSITHGTAAYGAGNLASLTDANSIVFDLREDFPIRYPEVKGPPYDPPGNSRGELRISASSPRVLYFDWDVSGLDYEDLPCPGAPSAFEWELLERGSEIFARATGDVYKGADVGGYRAYFNWRRLLTEAAPAAGTLDPFDPEIVTIDIDFDPDTGSAAWQSRIVPASREPRFWRGDANGDDKVDIADPVRILGYLFEGGGLAPPLDRADANDDGYLDIADPVYALGYLFGDRPPMAPAWQVGARTGGVDPTPDGL